MELETHGFQDDRELVGRWVSRKVFSDEVSDQEFFKSFSFFRTVGRLKERRNVLPSCCEQDVLTSRMPEKRMEREGSGLSAGLKRSAIGGFGFYFARCKTKEERVLTCRERSLDRRPSLLLLPRQWTRGCSNGARPRSRLDLSSLAILQAYFFVDSFGEDEQEGGRSG